MKSDKETKFIIDCRIKVVILLPLQKITTTLAQYISNLRISSKTSFL